MIGYPFGLPNDVIIDGKTSINYAVGNPMGAYSS